MRPHDLSGTGRAALVALALLAALTACTSNRPYDGPVDECPVCRVEGDLACLEVRVDDRTPTCTCDGRTYHFCSTDCREAFLAHPDRYAGR